MHCATRATIQSLSNAVLCGRDQINAIQFHFAIEICKLFFRFRAVGLGRCSALGRPKLLQCNQGLNKSLESYLVQKNRLFLVS